MASKGSLAKRIEILEQAIQEYRPQSAECICFPAKEPPSFNSWIEQEFASRVRCPEHGKRFEKHDYWVFVAGWKREENLRLLWKRSEQYRKAYGASFPSELWPAEREETGDGPYWRLKDGTQFLWD